jgi:chemotaxis protein histidine kinase CheA
MKHAKITFMRALLVLCAATCLLASAAPALSVEEDSSALARDVQRRFIGLTSVMSRLLAATESKDVGGRLDVALMRSTDLKIVRRLEVIRQYLASKAYQDALEEEKLVEKDLRRIYLVLQGLDDLETVRSEREERESLQEELERLERIQEEQQKNLEETEQMLAQQQNSASAEQNEADQKELEKKKAELTRKLEETQRKIDETRRSLGRQSPENLPQGDAQKKQEQEKQQLQSKNKKQGEQDKKKQPQSPSQPKPKPSESGKRYQQAAKKSQESLNKAARKTKSAAQRMRAENIEASRRDQEEALASLKKAQEELEKQLDEKNKEEQKKFMELAIARLHRLLADQQLLRTETEVLGEAMQEALAAASKAPPSKDSSEKRPDDKTGPKSEDFDFQGRSLARRERAIKTDAAELRELFAEEGSSAIAPAMLGSAETDLETVAERLDRTDAAEHTRSVQRDVEITMNELIDALKKKKGGGGGGGGSGGGSGSGSGGKPPPLLDPVKELRLLLNMQRRVRKRTERLEVRTAKPLPGVEQVRRGGDTEEIRRLANTHSKIGELLGTLSERYPVIDQYLLGKDNRQQAGSQDLEAPRGSDWDPNDLLPDPREWKGKTQKKKDEADGDGAAPK